MAKKATAMERVLEEALRRGAIPLCCSGASSCFALYSAKVTFAAKEWAILNTNESLYNGAQFSRQASLLNQHAGTCAALSVICAAATYEAVKDWRTYRVLPSLDRIESWLLQRPLPFFVRAPVLAVAAISLISVERANGGIQFLQPSQPLIISSRTRDPPPLE